MRMLAGDEGIRSHRKHEEIDGVGEKEGVVFPKPEYPVRFGHL